MSGAQKAEEEKEVLERKCNEAVEKSTQPEEAKASAERSLGACRGEMEDWKSRCECEKASREQSDLWHKNMMGTLSSALNLNRETLGRVQAAEKEVQDFDANVVTKRACLELLTCMDASPMTD